MNKEVVTFIICATIAILAAIAGGIIYNTNDRNNMAKNIEAAILATSPVFITESKRVEWS